MERAALARMIDQTLLKPTVGFAEAAAWMDEQTGHGFATLCVSPFLVPLAAQHLVGTETNVCSVVGFPLGYTNTESKAEEAAHLVELGCVEVDMVMNVAALLEGETDFVVDDIGAVVEMVRETSGGSALVKVIVETGYLAEDDIIRACKAAAAAGADFVKTSTGFGPRGASVEDVLAMRAVVGEALGVKASGGIRDAATAVAMVHAGASRIGTSSGAAILDGLEGTGG